MNKEQKESKNNTPQYDSGREGARRLHRIISLYCALFCWKNKVDAVALRKEALQKILGITRIEEKRLQWFKEEVKEYFEFFEEKEIKNTKFYVASTAPLESVIDTKSIKELKGSFAVFDSTEYLLDFYGASSKEKDPLVKISELLPFLVSNTASKSAHLLSIQMSALAAGTVSIDDLI